MVLEASAGCCESIIDCLESPGGCCEAICIVLQWNIYDFGILKKLSWSHDWWCGFSRRLLWKHLYTLPMKYWCFEIYGKSLGSFREAAVEPFTHCSNEILTFPNLWVVSGKQRWRLLLIVYNEILMIWNFRKAVVKPFAQFYNETHVFCKCFNNISKLAGSDVCRHRGIHQHPQ